MKSSTLLIFNPIANLGRAWNIATALRPVVDEMGGADWTGTVFPTHAAELAAQAADQGYQRVIALGGDGTVHEVVNGLMRISPDRRPALGIVPIGSGNDFAYSLGISPKPEIALRQVLSGKPAPIDIGRIEDEHGRGEFFSNSVGIGFDAIVVIRSRRVPIFQGFGIYFIAVLQTILLNHHPFHVTLTIDNQTLRDSLLMCTLMNGKREGGGFHLASNARQDDGIFNYVTMRYVPRLKMIATILPRFLNGTHASLSSIGSGCFQKMEIDSDRPLVIHTDGEIFAGLSSTTRKVKLDVIPSAIQAIRPAGQ